MLEISSIATMNIMDSVYIETSVISYLRQKPSNDVIIAAHQLLTHRWWDTERSNYYLVVSQYVIDEASAGDPTLAADRLDVLTGIPLLPGDPEIDKIAAEILARAILPPKAAVDALHIATVAHHRIQYLLTWNCKHIANAKILPRVHEVLTDLGVPIPIICTPEELLGDEPETEY
jgi:predicted nucleic acid-binding protein